MTPGASRRTAAKSINPLSWTRRLSRHPSAAPDAGHLNHREDRIAGLSMQRDNFPPTRQWQVWSRPRSPRRGPVSSYPRGAGARRAATTCVRREERGSRPLVARPHVHVVCRTIRQLTGGTRAEHRGSDRLAARVDLERLGGARYIVDGAGYNRARIPPFLHEQKPVPGRVVLEARDTQAPTRRDDTPHPLARKPPCERNAHCDETPASAVHARVEPTHSTTNMLLEVADLNPAAQDREPQGRCVCGEKVTIADAHEITLPNGRPGWEGYCPICRAPLFAIRRGSRASS